MNISIILAHPNPGSFNHAIAAAAAQTLETAGHAVAFHDLDQERFDPVMPAAEIAKDASPGSDLARHCREIAVAEGIIIVHPNWWGMPPAILKGWIDRVLRPEVAYRFVADDKARVFRSACSRPGQRLCLTLQTRRTTASATCLAIRWRPLEEMRFRSVRREKCSPPHLHRGRDEHGGAARSVAGGGARDSYPAVSAFSNCSQLMIISAA